MSTVKSSPPAKHIVDVLIEERAPGLAGSPLWPVLVPVLRAVLGYAKARRMADALAPLSGAAALDYISELLHLTTHVRGLERIPREGRCFFLANHPTGIADGIALYDTVSPLRPDLRFFANADALRICPRLIEVLIPAALMPGTQTLQRSKLTLRLAKQAIEEERAVAIFPAGALARCVRGRLRDQQWEHSAVALARRHMVPIIPLHVSGPVSRLLHFFGLFSEELRDITVFYEFLNKAGKSYRLTIGPPIDPRALDGTHNEVTRRLQAYVERVLPVSPDAAFAS